MNEQLNHHPLDKLMNDNQTFFLEALIPFVDFPMKKILVIFIKFKELTEIMENLNNPRKTASCGFDCKIKSQDELFDKLCEILPDEIVSNIKQTIKIINMMEIMNMNEKITTADSDFQCQASHEKNTSTLNNANSNSSDLYGSIMSILNEYDECKK